MEIKFVNIPNKFGVNKKIAISQLTEKQCEIQMNNCEKQLVKIDEELMLLKLCNIRLNKQNTVEAKKQQEDNINQMIILNKKLRFFEAVHFTVTNHYTDKYRSNEIQSFTNTLITA